MFGLWSHKQPPQEPRKEPRMSFLQGEVRPQIGGYADTVAALVDGHRRLTSQGGTMDAADGSNAAKMAMTQPASMSEALGNWFASQGFIGHQMAAILAQHWLVAKACAMPARDATRNGYDIVSSDGSEVPDDVLSALKKYDKLYRIRWQTEQFVRMGRIFGLRIALFDVESTDPEYYEKPFNPDGVTKGSYKGISQVDPYWCVPVMVGEELANPASRHFYEPTFWQINGRKYHRSHLIIFRNGEVPDILKPSYLYGGVPVPQLIMERVYGAERSASEAPMLVQSKRTNVWLTDMEKFIAGGDKAISRLMDWIRYRDNHGIKLGDKESDQFQQFDTALSELDNVIMTQYQLVAAAANVPATKLLGTAPKGFNSTGEYEEKSYDEELESIQEHDLTELVERHHLLVQRSFCDTQVETSVHWKPTDSPTSQQLAERNKLKSDTFEVLVRAGAMDGEDVRRSIKQDPDFGFVETDGVQDDVLQELGFSEEELQAAQAIGLTDGDEA